MNRAELVSDLKTLVLGRTVSFAVANDETVCTDAFIVANYLGQIKAPSDPGTVARALALIDAGICHSRTDWVSKVTSGAVAS